MMISRARQFWQQRVEGEAGAVPQLLAGYVPRHEPHASSGQHEQDTEITTTKSHSSQQLLNSDTSINNISEFCVFFYQL
jgi:hypothetical protein